MEAATVESLVAQLAQVQRRGGIAFEADGVSDWYEVMLFPAASAAEVAAAEAAVRKPLPEDFLRFWALTNGANLFINDSSLHGVGVSSTGLLAELQEDEVEVYGAAAMAPYLVFARVNGAGTFLAFDLKTGRVLDGVHAEQPHEWRPIAASFTHWLECFLNAGGRYYWIESLYHPERA